MHVCAVSPLKEREKVIASKACHQVCVYIYLCVCVYISLSPS